jgi:hypothetical protein
MSIDTRGRTAAEGLRAATPPVDAGTMLRSMHERRRQRSRRVVIAATLAVALAVGVVSAAVRQSQAPAGPGRRPTPGPSCPAPFPSTRPIAQGQSVAGMTCLGGRSFRRELQVPMTFTLPPTLAVAIETGDSDYLFWAGRLRAGALDHDTGVVVMEQVVAIRPTLTPPEGAAAAVVVDTAAGTTAESVARWLSERPFVDGAVVTETTLGGRRAYRVDLSRGAANFIRNGQPYGWVFANGTGPQASRLGVGPDTHVRCWLLDVPGAGLAMVWSQTNRSQADLELNQPLVDSIRFGD